MYKEIYSDADWDSVLNIPDIDIIRVKMSEFKIPDNLPMNIKSLWCQSNNIGLLPVLPNSLVSLICNDNRLSELTNIYDIKKSGLRIINCNNNSIVAIDINDNLTKLSAANNNLSYISELPVLIERVDFENNKFVEIPYIFRDNIKYRFIVYIGFNNNPIKYVSQSICNMLKKVYMEGGGLYRINYTDDYIIVNINLDGSPYSKNCCKILCNGDAYMCSINLCDRYRKLFLPGSPH